MAFGTREKPLQIILLKPIILQLSFKSPDWLYKVSPRLGISHVISDGATFTFNYGVYYQTPVYEQIYRNVANLENPGDAFEDAAASGVALGNASMSAGRTSSYEVGVNMEIDRSIGLSAMLWVKDMDQLTTSSVYNSGSMNIEFLKMVILEQLLAMTSL